MLKNFVSRQGRKGIGIDLAWGVKKFKKLTNCVECLHCSAFSGRAVNNSCERRPRTQTWLSMSCCKSGKWNGINVFISKLYEISPGVNEIKTRHNQIVYARCQTNNSGFDWWRTTIMQFIWTILLLILLVKVLLKIYIKNSGCFKNKSHQEMF